MKFKVKNFSTVLVGDYPLSKSFSNKVKDDLENYSGGIGFTNLKCIHTEWNWGCELDEVKHFLSFILETAFNNFDIAAIGDKKITLECSNFWANIYNKNDYADPHHHLPYNISFVYFLKSKWNDSPLIFFDSGKKVRPKEGRYVIFPSHLVHYVPKQKNSSKRITLAGNIKICTQ